MPQRSGPNLVFLQHISSSNRECEVDRRRRSTKEACVCEVRNVPKKDGRSEAPSFPKRRPFPSLAAAASPHFLARLITFPGQRRKEQGELGTAGKSSRKVWEGATRGSLSAVSGLVFVQSQCPAKMLSRFSLLRGSGAMMTAGSRDFPREVPASWAIVSQNISIGFFALTFDWLARKGERKH
jgi:hypothetical protein